MALAKPKKIRDRFPSKYKSTASSIQGLKQNAVSDYEIKGVISLRSKHQGLNGIQKCIGQMLSWYGDKDEDGLKQICSGTGTVYNMLNDNYCIIITCAHNMLRINEATDTEEFAKRVWYLPEGEQHKEKRLLCVYWICHDDYDPTLKHCPNDIGLILCYDVNSYYKNININCIHLTRYKRKKKKLRYCSIDGYPFGCNGKLMGMMGTVMLDKEAGQWKYHDLYTYPGHSGSVIYKAQDDDEEEEEEKEEYDIYGVHTFGNTETQNNRGVYLSKAHIKWIHNTEDVMEEKAMEHLRKEKEKLEKENKVNDLNIEEVKPLNTMDDEVRIWLKDTVGLGDDVIDILASNGYDSMMAVQTLGKNDLEEMGCKRGHVKQIMHFVEELKIKDDDEKMIFLEPEVTIYKKPRGVRDISNTKEVEDDFREDAKWRESGRMPIEYFDDRDVDKRRKKKKKKKVDYSSSSSEDEYFKRRKRRKKKVYDEDEEDERSKQRKKKVYYL